MTDKQPIDSQQVASKHTDIRESWHTDAKHTECRQIAENSQTYSRQRIDRHAAADTECRQTEIIQTATKLTQTTDRRQAEQTGKRKTEIIQTTTVLRQRRHRRHAESRQERVRQQIADGKVTGSEKANRKHTNIDKL